MSIDSKHPTYDAFYEDWIMLRDCYDGERAIKQKGLKYLPATTSMHLDGMGKGQVGFQNYENYRLRAVWHDLFKEAVEAYIGLLNYKPPQITIPDGMKGIRSNQGETLEQLSRRIQEECLITGRLGLLTDLPSRPNPANPLPYIAMYSAESVRNWDDGESEDNQTRLQFVILDESGYIRDTKNDFSWTEETRYRVCMLGNTPGSNDRTYMTGLFRVTGQGAPPFDSKLMIAPQVRGATMNEIPFTFVNSKDLLPTPDRAPLLGLANMMLSIYRGEADYRQNLFMQGQDTLVLIGSVRRADATQPDAPLRTGAGSRIEIDAEGDAKYVGVNSAGLSEQRSALANDRQRAEVRAGQLVNARVGDKESGEALKTRLAGQTATLKQIALTCGAAIEAQLRYAAKLLGEDPNAVKVEPNEEFSSTTATGQDLNQLMDAKDKGAPISYESLHAWMADRGITKKTFKEEFETIVQERAQVQVLVNPVQLEQRNRELDNQDPKNKPAPTAPTE